MMYKKGDKVIIIDHPNQDLWWDKAEITDYLDEEEIIVYIPVKKIRVRVNSQQIMDYELMKEFGEMVGAGPDDFTEWDLSEINEGDWGGSRDLPPTPDEEVCTCDMTELMRYGCRCEAGRRQLKEEHGDI